MKSATLIEALAIELKTIAYFHQVNGHLQQKLHLLNMNIHFLCLKCC